MEGECQSLGTHVTFSVELAVLALDSTTKPTAALDMKVQAGEEYLRVDYCVSMNGSTSIKHKARTGYWRTPEGSGEP